MKNILVPTDYSFCASNAAQYAKSLAHRFNAKIVLYNAHALVPQMMTETTPENLESMVQDIERVTKDKLKNYCQEIYGDQEVECIVQDVNLAEGIQAVCEKENIDLIVMGTKGESNLKTTLFGSNTSHVMEKTDTPVLIIPEQVKEGDLKKIVFATDYRDSDVESIKGLVSLATAYDAEIVLLHVSDGDYSEEYEKETLDWFNKEVKQQVDYPQLSCQLINGKDDSVVHSLDQFIHQEGADLLCMSTMKRNLFDKLFSASVTKLMSYQTDVPLLVFHSFAVMDDGDEF